MTPTAGSGRRFLIVYAEPSFWSMGPGIGAGSFSRTPRALAERGHEVHIVLPAERGMPGGEEEWEGIRLHRFPTRWSFHPGVAALPIRLGIRIASYLAYQSIGTRTALEVARKVRPDLVLSFGAYEAPVARRVAEALGVPNVIRIFGTSLSLSLDDPIRFRLNFPEVIAFRTPCAKLILTNDGANGELVAQRCEVPPERFVYLRNGLDFSLFSPGPPSREIFDRLGVPPGTPLLMTVTRLAFEKRLERVIEMMPALLRRVPSAVAVLLGEGSERRRLEKAAERLGVARSVRFPGAVANRELPSWFRSASIILSLLDRTNASNPVFEAMACERCVVALDTGTTREVIIPERTGVLVPADGISGLGDLLADLLDDHERRDRLGREARAHIRSLLLDPPARMDQEIAILLDVIGGARR